MTRLAHVRVLEDQQDQKQVNEVSDREVDDPEPDSSVPFRAGGFHIRAVPIDQPLGGGE
jgi:hypothetical protein